MRRRLPLVGFVLSVAVLAYAFGFLTLYKGLWPTEVLVSSYQTAEDLALHWQNDFGVAPTRLLVPAANAARRPTSAGDPARAAAGNRFIAGLMPARPELIGALLLDRAGRELHYWPVDYAKLAPRGASPNNVFMHGTIPMPDGSIVVSFDNGDAVARIGACGETVWVTHGSFHHAVSLSDRNTLWIWEYQEQPAPDEEGRTVNLEHLVELDAATGERLRQISLEGDIIEPQRLYGRFALHSVENGEELVYCCDHFHPNDVKALPAALAPAFPMFAAGDLLISLRSLNMVAVIDGRTAAMKWSQIGPWHRQHDPDFLPDGTISVLDNAMGLGASQVLVVNPANGQVRVAFDGARRGNFYTWRRGRHQALANGNIMLAETEKGRAIEVAPSGEIVWAYDNVYDATRNGLINEALVLPEDFFAEGALACPAS